MIKNIPLGESFTALPIAHRGLHSAGVFENTAEAYRLATEKGYGIELDVRLLKDGKLACVHDGSLKRLTGLDVAAESLTSEEIGALTLPDGSHIPLFEDVLRLVDGRAPILAELKTGEKFERASADALLSALENYPRKDLIALQSFHPFAVKYLKEHTADFPCGILSSCELGKRPKWETYLLKSLSLYGFIHADFISYDVNFLPNPYVLKKRKKGAAVLAWTVDSGEKMRTARSCADNIIFEGVTP